MTDAGWRATDRYAAASGPTGPPVADRQVFRREGEYWTIVYEAATFRLRDLKGLQHLAWLLRHPHIEVSAATLDGRAGGADAAPLPPDAAERARVNVTRAIAIALRRIGAHHPHLGQHLKSTLRTGLICAYRPDPRLPIDWES